MKLLYPLGLLGLISLVVLIIIYIIRPNYQQKFVSSTFVWKLSLKYRKKRIPISKLRNILLIICQVLILAISAMILTKPSEVLKTKESNSEIITIIDSSASMRTQKDGENRFTRAVEEAKDFVEKTVNAGGIASVILADSQSRILTSRATLENAYLLDDAFEPLLEEEVCSYGESDIEGAVMLCEDILVENPDAKIYLYTDISYASVPEGITIVDVSDEEEWNAGILNARAELEEGYYAFYVDVACYGQPHNVEVRIEVKGANAANSNETGSVIVFSDKIDCELNTVKTLIFTSNVKYDYVPENTQYSEIPVSDRLFSYQEVNISLSEKDSFYEDNNFNIYNGQKELLQVQYVSLNPNPFFPSVLATLKAAFADRWDIRATEVKKGGEFKTEGFDVYLFEHQMPEEMPKDGVVILVNPDPAVGPVPLRSGIQAKGVTPFGRNISFANEDEEHPILRNIDVGAITAQQIVSLTYEGTYRMLMSCANQPALLVKNEPTEKVAVLPFSLHYSNLAVLKEFPMLMYNIVEYFFPVTVNGNSFEVYENVSLNARGQELYVSRGSEDLYTFTEFPSILKVDLPGTYTLTQTTFTGKSVSENIYVKIPASESDITKQAETLPNPFVEEKEEDYYRDLLMYFAAALVAILFLEWFLQSRDNM